MATLSFSHSTPERARHQYIIRSVCFMSGYVAVNLAAILGAFDDASPRAALALALVVSAPLAGQIWAMLAYMRDADEYMRSVMAKRFVLGSGIAMVLFCAWGFLEVYAEAWHAPGCLLLPLFFAAYGAVSPFVRISH